MKENVNARRDLKYLMYARFLQQIINAQVPNLPKSNAGKIHLDHLTDMNLSRILVYRGRSTKPRNQRLICHLINPDYMAPRGNKWHHRDSDSDREELNFPPGYDKDDDDDDDNQDDDATNNLMMMIIKMMTPPTTTPVKQQQQQPSL